MLHSYRSRLYVSIKKAPKSRQCLINQLYDSLERAAIIYSLMINMLEGDFTYLWVLGIISLLYWLVSSSVDLVELHHKRESEAS